MHVSKPEESCIHGAAQCGCCYTADVTLLMLTVLLPFAANGMINVPALVGAQS